MKENNELEVLAERIVKNNMTYDKECLEKLRKVKESNKCEYGLKQEFTYIDESLSPFDILKEKLKELEELAEELEPKEYGINALKKRIKYCKNPLEKKELNRQLNNLYKKKKYKK